MSRLGRVGLDLRAQTAEVDGDSRRVGAAVVVAGISIGARDVEEGLAGAASSTSVVMGTVVT